MQIIYQNEAFVISFSQKLVSRASEVTRGQKSRKMGQISKFLKSRQIIRQNEARQQIISKNLVSNFSRNDIGLNFCIFTFQVESEDNLFLNFVFKEMFIERSSHLE